MVLERVPSTSYFLPNILIKKKAISNSSSLEIPKIIINRSKPNSLSFWLSIISIIKIIFQGSVSTDYKVSKLAEARKLGVSS